ncbi:MAG TPA: hypothetical protein VL485_09230 [Ktedonobacteraceae bacterium]|nr:hypothetical protein [Ktedonobacteraceae bacterium]
MPERQGASNGLYPVPFDPHPCSVAAGLQPGQCHGNKDVVFEMAGGGRGSA